MSHTPGPWVFSQFVKPAGEGPITSIADIGEIMKHSASYSDRLELFGVSLDDESIDGTATVVCYTGNGPNAHNNARLIAAAPELLAAVEAAIRYDQSIGGAAARGEYDLHNGIATAHGDDLDAMYEDWINKSKAAYAKATRP